jgi:hypothetical protein
VLSVNGRVRVSRRRYCGGGGGAGDGCPVDRLLDAAEATVSVGARELCCRLGIAGRSFARAAENLRHAAGLSMSAEQLRQVVEHEGKSVLAAPADGQLELDWSAADCKATTPDGREVTRMYASADGVIVPTTTVAEKQKRRATALAARAKMAPADRRRLAPLGAVRRGSDQRYKQVYVTILYGQDQARRLVGVTRKDHRAMGRLLARDAGRVRLRAAAERVGLVDGAVCLRTHLQDLPLDLVLLDFFHLSEHANDAKRQTLGEKADAGAAWAAEVLHTLRHDGYDPFFQKLLDWRSTLRGSRRKVADHLINYAAERQSMMRYAEAEARGWDVGTGPMESMCGATTDRIKGRGRRWDHDNAESVMGLEAMYQSNLWDRYWHNQLHQLN